jgi:hypothetical protein
VCNHFHKVWDTCVKKFRGPCSLCKFQASPTLLSLDITPFVATESRGARKVQPVSRKSTIIVNHSRASRDVVRETLKVQGTKVLTPKPNIISILKVQFKYSTPRLPLLSYLRGSQSPSRYHCRDFPRTPSTRKVRRST